MENEKLLKKDFTKWFNNFLFIIISLGLYGDLLFFNSFPSCVIYQKEQILHLVAKKKTRQHFPQIWS